MSSRPRHPGKSSDTSQDPYKLWRPQERQVESDSERPRYKTTTTNQAQRDQRDASYRDSPATASTSQHRSGPSTSRTLRHSSRPSTSNGHYLGPQQPVSNSTNPSTQQNHNPSRGQPPRSQAEIYDPRLPPKKYPTSASISTPQPSYERVPSSDEFAKSSRTNPYSRSGATVPQTTPEVWTPQDASWLSRKVKERERDKERDNGKERDREKEKVREKLKDITERYPEREQERHAEARPRDEYRDRDKARERERERERRPERETEVGSYRELRSTSRAPASRDAQDSRTRESGAPASSHRRHRSEEVPSSSVSVCHALVGIVDRATHQFVPDSAASYQCQTALYFCSSRTSRPYI